MLEHSRWQSATAIRRLRRFTALALTLVASITATGAMTLANAQPGLPPQPIPPTAPPDANPAQNTLPPADTTPPLEGPDASADVGSIAPPSSVPTSIVPATADSQNAQLLRLAERQLNPATLGLVSAALALRQLNDPNYRRKIGADLVSSEMNYMASMLNMGALYRGSIVRANLAASTMVNKAGALAANFDADISWELPICRVLGARSNIGFDRFADTNNLRGYVEGTACLPAALITMEFRVGYRFGVRPAVIDQALQAPKEFAGLDIGFDARAYRMLRADWDLDFWTMSLGTAFNDYEDPNQTDSASLQFTAAPISLHRYGRGFGGGTQTQEFLRTTVHALTNTDRSSVVVAYEGYRIEGLRIGNKVGLSFALGAARALVGDKIMNNELVTPGGFVGVAVGDLSAYTETRISSFAQASDRDIALSEYRATQRFVKQTEKIHLDAQAYVGNSRLVFIDSISDRHWVGGATVDALLPLWKGINLYVRGEAARILVPDAGNAVSVFATNALVGFTYSRQHDFVNHRRPITDPSWSGAVPVPTQPSR